nr:AraC family transcriptional regulator [uncultured Flavobacterium sp.]
MIKDLVNIELKNLPIAGLDIHIIKKYIVKTAFNESFTVNNLSILLIKSGSFKFKLKEAIQDLTARDLIVIPKNSFCTLLEVQEKLQLFIISFSSEFAVENCLKKELVDSFYFFVRKESFKIALKKKDFLILSLIYKLIYYINKDAKRDSFDFELQRISFNLFLYELRFIYSKYTSETLLHFSRKESLTIQFLTILGIHYKKQHNVSFYAGVLFVTPGYLNKIIKQITGKTVKTLILEAIVVEAKNFLENSQSTIAVIAEELEFSSASTFSIFFRKHTSFSPSEFRSNAIERSKIR